MQYPLFRLQDLKYPCYHLKVDLPKRLKLLSEKYPGLEFSTGSALIEQLNVRKSISEQIKQVTFS